MNNEEWRIVQRTRASSLKQLWVRLRSGLWAPTERFMTEAQMMPPILGGSPGVVDKQVANTADDGTRRPADLVTIYIRMGQLGGSVYHAFLRWIGVTYEGTVDVSYIECYHSTSGGTLPLMNIYGVDENNPAAPTSAAEFDADPLTTAFTPWDAKFAGTWNQSPSCNGIFQELVDTHGPFINTAIMAQVKDDGSANGDYNSPFDFGSDAAKAAKLHIEFSVVGVGVPPIMDNYHRRRVVQG